MDDEGEDNEGTISELLDQEKAKDEIIRQLQAEIEELARKRAEEAEALRNVKPVEQPKPEPPKEMTYKAVKGDECD